MKKKMITAAIGGALLGGVLLGAGMASTDVYYEDCRAAWADHAAPLHKGDPGYSDQLARDGDGVASSKPAAPRDRPNTAEN